LSGREIVEHILNDAEIYDGWEDDKTTRGKFV